MAKIENYVKFMKTHRKYSHSHSHNMICHGYRLLIHFGDINPKEKSRVLVEDVVKTYGDGDYVYYRTKDGWGLPYLFVYSKI